MAPSDVLHILFIAYILPLLASLAGTATIRRIPYGNGVVIPEDHQSAYSNDSRQSDSPNAPYFLLNQHDICDREPYLVIVVCSNIVNFDRRQAVRDTWGSITSHPHARTLVLFFVGKQTEENNSVQATLSEESATYHDIIQADFLDSYRNLSLKSVAYLRWLDTHCKGVKYVLKTDDDMFINVPLLLHDLHNTVHHRFLMGNIIAGAQPMRDRTSKWFTPLSVFSGKMYPTYMSGTAYVISGDAIHDMFSSTQTTEFFWLEDIYITGLCARKANLNHIFNDKFGYKKRSLDPCYLKTVITAHGVQIDELRNIWKSLKLDTLDCSQTLMGTMYKS